MVADSTQRILNSVQELVNAGDYYSAHQKYRTSATRLLKPSSARQPPDYDDKAKEAAHLLFIGARTMLSKNELGSGIDLAKFLVEVYSTRNVPCLPEQRVQIQQLLAMSGHEGTWRKSLADQAFQWTAKVKTGGAQLHEYYGNLLASENDFINAEPHLLLCPTSDAALSLADATYRWFTYVENDVPANSGRYAARAVFSYLEQGYVLPARAFLGRFLSHFFSNFPDCLQENASLSHPPQNINDDEIQISNIPSLNFLQLLIRTCQIGSDAMAANSSTNISRAAYQSLIARYERQIPWLQSPDVVTSREQIAESYFGIMPSRRNQNDMLNSLMSGLFGGGDGSSASSTPRGAGHFTSGSKKIESVSAPDLD